MAKRKKARKAPRCCPTCGARKAGLTWYLPMRGRKGGMWWTSNPTTLDNGGPRNARRCKDMFHGVGGWAR